MTIPVGSNHKSILPLARYEDLRLPDGSHSGVRVDAVRGILEVQKRGIRYYFDLTQIIVKCPIAADKELCYDTGQ